MYGLDKTTNFKFLVGKELLQLCISEVQIILRLDDEISISIECDLRLGDKDGEVIDLLDISDACKHLYCLIGSKVENVTVLDFGNLLLEFSNGYKLTLMDSNECTESYVITALTQRIIV